MRRLLASGVLVLALMGSRSYAVEMIDLGGRGFVVVGQCDRPYYSIKLALGAPPGQAEMSGLAVAFAADRSGTGYLLTADAAGWRLTSMGPAGERELARSSAVSFPTIDQRELLIKRRDWLLTVAVDGRVVFEEADADHFAGLVAVDPLLSGPAGEPVVQTVGRLFFEDGFMRPIDDLSLGEWKPQAGQWRLHSVREAVDDMNLSNVGQAKLPQSERSANPFCMSGQAEGAGLLTTGYWFWDDYAASVSVRNDGAEALGLAFNVRSPEDYFLLRWDAPTRVLAPARISLLRVRDGRSAEIGSAWVNGQLGQWYSLGVRTEGRRIQAVLDEAVIIDVRHDGAVGGQIGLYVDGGDGKRQALFDDIQVRTVRGHRYDDATWLADHVALRGGEWEVVDHERPARPANSGAVLRSTDGRLVLGHGGWPASLVSARVTVPAVGQRIGFVVGADAEGAQTARVTLSRGADGPRLAITSDGPDGQTELASCTDFSLPDTGTVELAVDGTRPHELNAYVDGRLRLHLERKDAGRGAAVAFAQGFPGAEFRDLEVAFERTEDVESLPDQAVFREDPFMTHWSSPKGAWWPVEGRADAWWHVGDFIGRSEVEVPCRAGILFVHSATELTPQGGYALVQEEAQQGTRLKLLRLGQEVAAADVAEGTAVVLCKEGPYLWAAAGGQEIFAFRDADPLRGTRVALAGVEAGALTSVKVQRNHVRDYYFQEAPTDWHQTGTWKVTTRFSCDPRWSFMTALATQNAVLFNKFFYEGDVTVEAHMGTRMGTPERGGGEYWRVGDFNLALCANLMDLDSGYNFVVAGWDRFWSDLDTYLLKGTERLALTTERLLPNVRRETTRERPFAVPWINPARPIHGGWYYIKARKQGNELSSWVDNRLAYRHSDAEPLQQVSPAVWTYDTHTVLARMRISYEKRTVPGRLVEPPAVAGETEPAVTGVPLLVSATHPGFFDDFEAGLRGWHTYEGMQSAVLSTVPSGAGGRCLRVQNPGEGGLMDAAVSLEDAGISATRARLLSFDYRIPPDVQVNLFLKVDGQHHFVHLTGPDTSNAFYRRLGRLAVQADGEWHRAEFPLAAAFRDAGQKPGIIEKLVFGNLHRGAAQAGLGANGLNAAYMLDNVKIASIGPADFAAECREGVPKGGRLLSAIDAAAGTVPVQEGAPSGQDLAPGEWTCHVRAVGADGTATGVGRLPFIVASAPLTAQAVEPASGGAWGYSPVEVQFSGPSSPFLDPDSLKLSVNGAELQGAPDLFEMDWAANRLRINCQTLDTRIADGQAVAMELAYVDELGRPGSCRMDYVASQAEDRTPPSAVTLDDYLAADDFEEDLGAWQGSRDASLIRDDGEAASGRYSLKVQNLRWGSAFTAFARKAAFSVGAYPLVEFDYRAHRGVMFDLVANNSRGYATVGLADKCNYGHYIGEVAAFQADGQWRHAEFDLLTGMNKVPYRRGVYNQKWLALGDFGYRSNAIGSYYNVDNFRLVPLVSAGKPLTLSWQARDASGISGYSYLWSAAREDSPDDTIDSAEPTGTFGALPVPDAYFHVKARDAAGNWGPVSHFRFRADAAPPAVVQVSPGADERSAASRVTVKLADEGSVVDPDTFTLSIDGRVYRPYTQGVDFSAEQSQLTWDWVRNRPPEQRSVPDGTVVQMEVAAADFAGNSAPVHKWQWTMDHSLDRDPPSPPALMATSMPVKVLEDFQENAGAWRNRRGNDWGADIKRVWRDEQNGDYCLQLFATRQNSYFDAIALDKMYDLREYPLISFDYMMPEPVKVNMQVLINKNWFEIVISAPKRSYRELGRLPDVKADNAWHHATVDVLALAEKALPNAEKLVVQSITVGDPARSNNRKNARWFVDNFMVSGWGAPDAELEWRSEDITGVAGYSVVFDREMGTAPQQQVSSEAEAGKFAAAEPGTYWLHAAAFDGNGNWSRPRHLAYTVPEPAPPAPEAPLPPPALVPQEQPAQEVTAAAAQ